MRCGGHGQNTRMKNRTRHYGDARKRPQALRRRRWRRWLWLPPIIAALLLLGLRWVTPPTTAFMWAWSMSHDHPPDWRWRPLAQISPQLALAVVAAEDQRFPSHWGFDLEAIQSALQDRQRGASRRGASTISQQVAKNLFLWSEASWLRKGLEAGLTSGIELAWGKRRILEMYLNVAEFGDGVYGAEAAAQRFFGVPAQALTGHQAAQLAALLPSPKRRSVANPSRAQRARVAWIEQQMLALGGTPYLAPCCLHP